LPVVLLLIIRLKQHLLIFIVLRLQALYFFLDLNRNKNLLDSQNFTNLKGNYHRSTLSKFL
jgi:hypothetical protein